MGRCANLHSTQLTEGKMGRCANLHSTQLTEGKMGRCANLHSTQLTEGKMERCANLHSTQLTEGKMGRCTKRWSTIMILLESSEGGGKGDEIKQVGGPNLVRSPPPPLVAPCTVCCVKEKTSF